MIKIAHEAPIGFMPTVQAATDYDYALACLFDKVPGYYEFFVEALKKGRHVLLDNGVFEDGVPMDRDQYAKWIEKLQPTEYIIPDEFDKKDLTINHYINWCAKYNSLPGKKIGVCQGTSFDELDDCYKFYSMARADKIAINFASVAYQNIYKGENDRTWDENAVDGRASYLLHLVDDALMDTSRQHHLLGCVLPIEFSMLKKISVCGDPLLSYFDSIDTSSPVVWGIVNGIYPECLNTIEKKIKTKIKDLITTDLTVEQKGNILFNIAKFRHYLHNI